MPKALINGIEFEVDWDCFIQEPEKWSNQVAEELAKSGGTYPMSDDGWKVVNYLRNYYLEFGTTPYDSKVMQRDRV